MTRYGAQFGPDFTFLGVPECDLDDETSYSDADVVILGAPFNGGTSYRAGTRFGPQAIRMTDYLPHDGSRPSLALRADGLQDLKVYDAGDVEICTPATSRLPSLLARRGRGEGGSGRRDIGLARRGSSIAYPDAKGCANVIGDGRVWMIRFDTPQTPATSSSARCGAAASRCVGSSNRAPCAVIGSCDRVPATGRLRRPWAGWPRKKYVRMG